eukprot:3784769-Prymnesium_polylepis.2
MNALTAEELSVAAAGSSMPFCCARVVANAICRSVGGTWLSASSMKREHSCASVNATSGIGLDSFVARPCAPRAHAAGAEVVHVLLSSNGAERAERRRRRLPGQRSHDARDSHGQGEGAH